MKNSLLIIGLTIAIVLMSVAGAIYLTPYVNKKQNYNVYYEYKIIKHYIEIKDIGKEAYYFITESDTIPVDTICKVR